jgi:predicted lipase
MINYQRAAKAARLSQIAYLDKSQFTFDAIRKYVCPQENIHFIENRQTDTQCYVINEHETTWIVFRGTDDVRDWLTNLDYEMKIHSGWAGMVHDGFARAFISVYRDILEFIIPSNRVVVCGHSLGAALATLGSSQFGSESECYAFCSPRVGDYHFASQMDSRASITRFTRHKDPVPRVPPYTAGYRHCGTDVYIDSHGKINEGLSFWLVMADVAFGDMSDYLRLGDTIEDHDIGWIADRLEEEANG